MKAQDIKFVQAVRTKAQEISKISRDHGFEAASEENFGTKIALIHSEISEAFEGFRAGNPMSEHTPGFTVVAEELADAINYILDLSHEMGLGVPEALVAKVAYNTKRPFRHGKRL